MKNVRILAGKDTLEISICDRTSPVCVVYKCLKCWILEVNLSPSLNVEAPIDMKIKSAMIWLVDTQLYTATKLTHTLKVNTIPSIEDNMY
jgi:hypothetical protein